MTMATINLLLGVVSIILALAIALGALEYAVEGVRSQGGRRRWNLVIAVILGAFAWSLLTGIGQDFARASDATLLSRPADAGGLTAVVFSTLITALIVVADIRYWRGAHRSPASRA